MFATLRSVSKGRNHGFADRDKSRARPFNASTLTTYAGTFEKQRQGVGEQIGLRNPGIPAEPRQAVALRRLEFLDDVSRRMIALGQLDRHIGHVAAAAIAARALGAATNPGMKLRERVIGMGGFKSIPDRFGVSGDVAQARNHQIVQLDPIYVTFNPSETDLVAIQRARAAGKVAADILLPGETRARHGGELTFIDNAVDRSTGTIVARATIGNADLGLLPGQYVRIRLAIGTEPDALMVPEAALGSSQLGKYVYVVGEGNKVDQRLVSLGPSDSGLVAVLKGVSEGERVINGNLQKIGPGALVQPLIQ
jgi:multidrug efflux pump subunit AcrA (membrane-fusion protein)